jgi:hypothetical protein
MACGYIVLDCEGALGHDSVPFLHGLFRACSLQNKRVKNLGQERPMDETSDDQFDLLVSFQQKVA